eukprot:gene16192-4921_t
MYLEDRLLRTQFLLSSGIAIRTDAKQRAMSCWVEQHRRCEPEQLDDFRLVSVNRHKFMNVETPKRQGYPRPGPPSGLEPNFFSRMVN